MKLVVEFKDGAKLRITENGFKVYDVTENCTEYGGDGFIIPKYELKVLRHFSLMGKKERMAVKEWVNRVSSETKNQEEFIDIVKEAIEFIDYNYYISTMEPSFSKTGDIIFKKGAVNIHNITLVEWKEKAEDILSCEKEWNSTLATLHELYFWYAWRISEGYWTLEYVCDDSSSYGNYADSATTSHKLEGGGERVVGGFYDGTGNTVKIVKHNDAFALVGGCYINSGKYYPVGHFYLDPCSYRSHNFAVGVVVVRRNIDI